MRTIRHHQQGLTLVEAMITVCIAGTLLAAGLPGFQQAREQRQVESAAAQLETDIQLARSEALLGNRNVRLDFSGSCYVLHTGAAGDCDCSAELPVCRAGVQPLRSVRIGADEPLTLHSNSASMVFDALAGTVTPTATVRVVARSGAAVHAVVNVMGRVRSCSPTLPGYKAC